MGDYIADIKEQLLPRCDDKCQPMKQCKSSCKSIKSKCVPASLQGYFPMVKKGGSLRSMLPMIGLTEGSPEVRVIDAWLNKLDKCNSDDLSSSSNCLSSKYTGSACEPRKQVLDKKKEEEKETKKEDEKETKKEDQKETKKEEEKETKKEEETETTGSVTPSGQCKKIKMGGSMYYGTVSDGFTVEEVNKGAKKLVSLFGMVGGLLGAEVGSLVSKCKGDYIADIKEQLLPLCDDKCQPMKQCKSSCKSIKSKCVPASLQSYFPMVKKGGSLRSMLPMIGLTEGSSE